MGLDRIIATPTITVDQDKYDDLIKISDRYQQLIKKDKNEKEFFDFGKAIELLKDGKKLQREGWNGKELFVYYVPANKYEAITKIALSIADDENKVQYEPYFAIKNAKGTISTWVPSISDCLAEDWKIAKEEK